MLQYLIVCPLVFLAGLVDSIAGGGGLIALPAYLIAGVPAHVALGTNKLSSAMGTTVSTARLAKHGFLKGKVLMAVCSSAAALMGSALGAHLALMVPAKVINLSSNIAALVTFIATGNVYYPLGLTAGVCSIAGHYIGAGMVAHDGQKVVRPVVLAVLGVLFIKIVSGT